MSLPNLQNCQFACKMFRTTNQLSSVDSWFVFCFNFAWMTVMWGGIASFISSPPLLSGLGTGKETLWQSYWIYFRVELNWIEFNLTNRVFNHEINKKICPNCTSMWEETGVPGGKPTPAQQTPHKNSEELRARRWSPRLLALRSRCCGGP